MSDDIRVVDSRVFDVARQQISRIKETAIALCDAMRYEHEAIRTRDAYFNAAVESLIGQPNPATNKPHSQDSAEKAAKQHPEYARLAAARIEAECARLCASSAHEASRLSARLSVAVVEHAIPTGDLH